MNQLKTLTLILAGLVMMTAVSAVAEPPAVPDNTLWQIGIADGSRSEFTGSHPDPFRIDDGWKTGVGEGSTWPGMVKNMVANRGKPLDIVFDLDSPPKHGVELQLGILGSTKLVPQLAVYSNQTLAGIIQTWGPKGTKHGKTHDFIRTYRLYIPAELLAAGENELRLAILPQPYGSDPGMSYFDWDFLRLIEHTEPVDEPIHGSYVRAGTNMTLGADGPKAFHVNEHNVRLAQPLLEWLGIAYSGNFMRAPYWSNVSRLQTHRRELLEAYRDLNMTVILNTLYLGGFTPVDGQLPEEQREQFDTYMAEFGDLVQWVEVANEPGLIGPLPQENVLAFTKYVDETVPEHVQVLGPGWAFNTWAGDADQRKAIEQYCDAIGGHAYGLSFNNTPGGSFIEQLLAYAPLTDALPKPFINTEFGSNEWHHDWDANDQSTQPKAAAFERNMRAHIAFGDGMLQHAAFFNHEKKEFEKFSMFADPQVAWDEFDALDTWAWPGIDGQDSRLQSFRRLALAYSTHGSPLKWELLNADELAYTPVYVRCVDTSTLRPLQGSGATSDKLLLNFVNFDDEPRKVKVRVWLPEQGRYSGLAIGPGEQLRDARSEIELQADPQVEIELTLPAREGVQYILEKD